MSRSKGSAPVDFILVSVPLILLCLSVLGVAINGYAKNVAQDVAIEAARFAALADQDAKAGRQRALQQLSAELGLIFKPTVTADQLTEGETCIIRVAVTLKPMRLGLLNSNLTIREDGQAVCELQ